MVAPAPTLPPVPKLEPQLRLVKALAHQRERDPGPVIRKIGWAVVVALLGVALVLAILAQGGAETDPDQRWFWEPEWLRGELEAQQEIAAGTGTTYQSTDEFLSHLDDLWFGSA